MSENDIFFKIDHIQNMCSEVRSENFRFHEHNFYSVYWITQGEAVHSTAFIDYTVKENTLFFVPANLKHRMVITDNTQGITILFNRNFFNLTASDNISLLNNQLFYNTEYKTTLPLHTSDIGLLQVIIDMMINEYTNPNEFKTTSLNYQLKLFLIQALRIYSRNPQQSSLSIDTDSSTIISFKSLIEDNFQTNKDVSYYADKLNLRAVCLNDITKKVTGITAGELIRNRIIDEAKKLLYSTHLNVKEIAFRLGFDDPAYFSRFFKKYTNQSVTDFKEFMKKSASKV